MDKYVQQINKKLPSWAKSSESKPAYHYHKVRYPGESLSVIAEWYTGDVENWPHLAKANSKIDPEHITIGTTILIPKNLLHTSKPMPKDFVEVVAKRHKAERAQVAKAPPPKPSYYHHRVKYSGETLSIIAKWYTGDAENWQALTKANPKLDPKRINVGDRIRIPRKLLNTKRPMPRSFVVASTKKRKQKAPTTTPSEAKTTKTAKKEEAPPPESASKEPEVLELFGPK